MTVDSPTMIPPEDNESAPDCRAGVKTGPEGWTVASGTTPDDGTAASVCVLESVASVDDASAESLEDPSVAVGVTDSEAGPVSDAAEAVPSSEDVAEAVGVTDSEPGPVEGAPEDELSEGLEPGLWAKSLVAVGVTDSVVGPPAEAPDASGDEVPAPAFESEAVGVTLSVVGPDMDAAAVDGATSLLEESETSVVELVSANPLTKGRGMPNMLKDEPEAVGVTDSVLGPDAEAALDEEPVLVGDVLEDSELLVSVEDVLEASELPVSVEDDCDDESTEEVDCAAVDVLVGGADVGVEEALDESTVVVASVLCGVLAGGL